MTKTKFVVKICYRKSAKTSFLSNRKFVVKTHHPPHTAPATERQEHKNTQLVVIIMEPPKEGSLKLYRLACAELDIKDMVVDDVDSDAGDIEVRCLEEECQEVKDLGAFLGHRFTADDREELNDLETKVITFLLLVSLN
jgi:hypothetical protein